MPVSKPLFAHTIHSSRNLGENCRKKHTKCSRTLPQCQECLKKGYVCVYLQPKKEYLQKMLLTGQVQKPVPNKQKKKDFEIHSFRYETTGRKKKQGDTVIFNNATRSRLELQSSSSSAKSSSDVNNSELSTRYHPYNQNIALQKNSNIAYSTQYIDNFVDAFGFDPSSSKILQKLHTFLDNNERRDEDSNQNSKELEEMLMQDMIVTSFVKINSFEYYHR